MLGYALGWVGLSFSHWIAEAYNAANFVFEGGLDRHVNNFSAANNILVSYKDIYC